MKFRSKAVEIEAALFDGERVGAPDKSGRAILGTCPEWLPPIGRGAGEIADLRPGEIAAFGRQLAIGTLEGVMTAQPGDWIIRGTEGELYPCKPSVFERKYEPA